MKTKNKKTEQKKYVVVWLYMANHGVNEIEATSPEEAIKQVWGGNTKAIKYIVTEKKNVTIFERD
jgi:hypothetical protein